MRSENLGVSYLAQFTTEVGHTLVLVQVTEAHSLGMQGVVLDVLYKYML